LASPVGVHCCWVSIVDALPNSSVTVPVTWLVQQVHWYYTVIPPPPQAPTLSSHEAPTLSAPLRAGSPSQRLLLRHPCAAQEAALAARLMTNTPQLMTNAAQQAAPTPLRMYAFVSTALGQEVPCSCWHSVPMASKRLEPAVPTCP
jgi:hypothetical protein